MTELIGSASSAIKLGFELAKQGYLRRQQAG